MSAAEQLALTVGKRGGQRHLIGDDEVAPTLPLAAQSHLGAGLRAGLDLQLELGTCLQGDDDLAAKQSRVHVDRHLSLRLLRPLLASETAKR